MIAVCHHIIQYATYKISYVLNCIYIFIFYYNRFSLMSWEQFVTILPVCLKKNAHYLFSVVVNNSWLDWVIYIACKFWEMCTTVILHHSFVVLHFDTCFCDNQILTHFFGDDHILTLFFVIMTFSHIIFVMITFSHIFLWWSYFHMFFLW